MKRGAAAGGNLLVSLAAVALFFGLVEAVLWVADVEPLLDERDPFHGFSPAVRVFEERPERGVLATTTRATRRSFNHQEFLRDKPAGGFRFFTLGGSSAYGFPWGASVAFTRLLGDALQATWPGRPIEAVNASGMSYGSHRLRILAREISDYHPDTLVVYEGHNEFIETRFRDDLRPPHEGLDRLRAILHRWRLYSVMTRTAERLGATARSAAPGAGVTTGELLGLDVAREEGMGKRDAQKRQARERLEENLRGIAATARAAGARVVFCTVASNLKDWAPNQSLFDPALPARQREQVLGLLEGARGMLARGDAAGAAAALEEARSIAPDHAEISYTLGRAFEAMSRWDDARAAYVRARDADAQPSRAIGSFNDTIRRVANDTGMMLADIERTFEKASPHGLVGFDLIEDYVHPTPGGHRLIALELWKTFNEGGLLGAPRVVDAAEFWRTAGGQPDGAPPGIDSRKASELLYNQAFVLEHQGLVDQAIEKYRACLELSPGYGIAAFNLGRLLHLRRRPDLAAAQFRRALESEPDHVLSMVGLGMALIGLDDVPGASQVFRRAVRKDPGSAAAWNGLGHALAIEEDLQGAEEAFRKAFELDPANAGAVGNLGSVHLMQGKLDEAIREFRTSLSLRHDQPRVRDHLADALTRAGSLDEAEQIYRATLASDPDDARARAGLERIQLLRAGALR